ncbi:MAG TPA: hypothetical protein VGM29_10600 [Polyangiaceae bacterium]
MLRRAAMCAGPLALACALAVRTGFAQVPEGPRPPPINVEYFQYGVALVVDKPLSGGDVCPVHAVTPCILGGGGGFGIQLGYRSRGPWYAGGAFEISRHDSSNLLRLAILQQLRGEARYYFEAGNRLTPYVAFGLGAAIYGNEWGASTAGPEASTALGLEFQVTQSVVLGFALGYRALFLRGWTDSTGQERADHYLGFGLAHLLGLGLTFERRDPLARW